ncbi:hypothetical protein K435DRAFT_963879 [Dendrothele bispora CBS 962.96]|uniref:Uncharacterized protein n=1 Tax=Dendrothele bispora (strain CBS 962.96) TaxID=1314807 RepID=A0A4S8MDQ5_DENBC|nr:hypothetical protein K435DRAFT_963879 [Dendrothele bispora CBS 962.96]
MSSQTPLLHDDELNSSYSETRNEHGEENEHREELPGPGKVKTGSFMERIWKKHRRLCLLAFAALSVIIVATVVLVAVFVPKKTTVTNPGQDDPPVDENLASDSRLEKYLTLEDTLFCPDWTEAHDDSSQSIISTASFNLPPSTDLTFFLSRGSPIVGHFNIYEKRASSGDITVDVVAQYEDTDEGRNELTHSKACFAGQKNEQGVMLWADSEVTLSRVKFNISVHLPDIQRFHDISTDFSNGIFQHFIEGFFDIWRPTYFGVVRLNARNAIINVNTIMASSSFIQTTNAEVWGNFWASDSISVQTSNAAVFTTLWAIGEYEGANTSVSVRTNNGPIRASISMQSDFNRMRLNASLHTSNGNITTGGPRFGMGVDKALFFLDASTTNAPALMYVHPDYEGLFDIQTTGGDASILETDQLVHPDYEGLFNIQTTGGTASILETDQLDGRKRVIDIDRVNEKDHKAGKIYWDEEPPYDEQGDINLRTTKQDVTILYSQ